MLGVHLAPSGNNKDHVAALRAKAEQWASNIQSSSANSEEVWTSLHRTIPFSICYSLPAVTLTKEECRYIMAPITKKGLPLAGVVSTIPHVFKVGPISFGGIGIVDPYIHMGTSQIATFHSNIWQQTPTGRLLEIAIDDLALELGLPIPWTTEHLVKGMKYASTTSWIRHMVRFSLDNDIQIDFGMKGMLLPNQRYDRMIMDIAVNQYDQGSTLQSINKIRMALNVVWLSDISTADGRNIDRRWLSSQHHPVIRNNHKWPGIHHITSKDWRCWKALVETICTHQDYTLRYHLGEWQCETLEWVNKWDSFTTLNDEFLYIRRTPEEGWRRHVIMQDRQRRQHHNFNEYLLCNELHEAPENLKRVSYKKYHTYLEVTSWGTAPRPWRSVHTANAFWNNTELSKETLLNKYKIPSNQSL